MTTLRNNTTQGRKSAGNDGAFAPHERTTAIVTLTPDWGEVSAPKAVHGDPVQYVEPVADGIAFLATAGHGYYKLSPKRQAAMPEALRVSGGMYEEDAEWRMVAAAFPDAFPKIDQDENMDRLRYWYPDRYERHTGDTVQPGQSWERDQQLWSKEHENEFVASGWGTADHNGQVIVEATRQIDGVKRRFRVKHAEMSKRRNADSYGGNGRFVIDPATDEDLGEVAPIVHARYPGLDLSQVPASAAASVGKALAKRYRMDDRSIRTLRQLIEEDGMTGKTVDVRGGRRTYMLQRHIDGTESTYSAFNVPKALWDAAHTTPDTRSERSIRMEDYRIAQDRYEAAQREVSERRSWSVSIRASDQKKLRELREKYEAEQAKFRAWSETNGETV